MCWYRKNTEKPKPTQRCWTGQPKAQNIERAGQRHCTYSLCSLQEITGIWSCRWRLEKGSHHTNIQEREKIQGREFSPSSITCICCKLMEHIVTSHIMRHADDQNIVYPLQYGFRSKRSGESQLIIFIDDISKNMTTDVLVMDFSKAFDKVSHPLLV